MQIKIISAENICEWAKDNGIPEPYYDLTDEQFSEINENYDHGWSFDSWEEFVSAFNRDDNCCPTPTCHYIRVFN